MDTQLIAVVSKLFIGIDIQKRSWKVHCGTDLHAGKTFTMTPDPKELKKYVEKHYSNYDVSAA
jgi:hypothetical protein